jgi:hypothetical protein
MEAQEDLEDGAVAGAGPAPEVWEHPTETTEATAAVDETVLMVRRGGAEASS